MALQSHERLKMKKSELTIDVFERKHFVNLNLFMNICVMLVTNTCKSRTMHVHVCEVSIRMIDNCYMYMLCVHGRTCTERHVINVKVAMYKKGKHVYYKVGECVKSLV